MSEINPYQAPRTDAAITAEIATTGGIWRQGKILVLHKTAVLPDRCVHCNAPADGRRLKRRLYWHHPLLWLLLLFSPLIYIIVALIVRQKAVVAIGLCDRHYRRRLGSILAWWLIAAACVALFCYGVTAKQPWLLLAALLIFLGNLFFAVTISTPVAPQRIDEQYVWLRKVHRDFLAEFPAI